MELEQMSQRPFIYNALKTTVYSARCLCNVEASGVQTNRRKTNVHCIKTNTIYYEILTIYKCIEKQSMTKGCSFDIKLIFYDPSRGLQFSQCGWMLRYSVQVVFNNFRLLGSTYRRQISSNQKRLFFAVCLYPLSFFENTTLNEWAKKKQAFICR